MSEILPLSPRSRRAQARLGGFLESAKTDGVKIAAHVSEMNLDSGFMRKVTALAVALAATAAISSMGVGGEKFLNADGALSFSSGGAPSIGSFFDGGDKLKPDTLVVTPLVVEAEKPAVDRIGGDLMSRYPDAIQHPTTKIDVKVITGWKNGKAKTEASSAEVIHPLDRIRLCQQAAEGANLKRMGLTWRDVYSFVSAETNWAPRSAVGLNGVRSEGLGQFEAATARMYKVSDPNDPVQALRGVAQLIRDAASWTRRVGHADPAAALSVYYNTSTAVRQQWDGRDLGALPEATRSHIQNRGAGLREASVLERKFAPLLRAFESARHVAGHLTKPRLASEAVRTPVASSASPGVGARVSMLRLVAKDALTEISGAKGRAVAQLHFSVVSAVRSVAAKFFREEQGPPVAGARTRELPVLTQVIAQAGGDDQELLMLARQVRSCRNQQASPRSRAVAEMMALAQAPAAISRSILRVGAHADALIQSAVDFELPEPMARTGMAA